MLYRKIMVFNIEATELCMRRFTPMLPSTAVGTVEFRSLCEPIRTSNRFVEYVGATCEV